MSGYWVAEWLPQTTTFSTLVETKVISGLASASKKSPETRWPSRSGLPVSMLAVLMVTFAHDLLGSAASMWAVPSKSLKAPRTVETIACRALKPIRVWLGSMV